MAGFVANQGPVASSSGLPQIRTGGTTKPKVGPGGQLYGSGVGTGGIGKNTMFMPDATDPTGYKWDPVKGDYVRTPESLGQDAAAVLKGLDGASSSSAASSESGSYTNPPQITMQPWGGGGAGSGAGSTGSFPTERLTPPDTSAAQSAEFARAKDKAGLVARGALTGLEGAMAGRGTVGSGVEGRAMQGIINEGQQQLGEVSRQQAMTGAELAQKNAELAYQGGIQQRGQDITQSEGAASRGLQGTLGQFEGNIAMRGQDIQSQISQKELELKRQQSQQQQILDALKSITY
jgi:hypothetical protein